MIELALLIALSMILPPEPQRPPPEPVCIVEPARPHYGDERFRAALERREARRQREACGCGPDEGEGRQEGCEGLWDGALADALPPPAVFTAARPLAVFPRTRIWNMPGRTTTPGPC